MISPTVLLVHPTGRFGGGMMRVADYQRGAMDQDDLTFESLDVRGDVPLAATPLVFAWRAAALRTRLRRGDIALVHLFAGDRLSLLRKCAIARIAQQANIAVLLHLHAYDFARTMQAWPRRVSKFVADTFGRVEGVVVLGPSAAADVQRCCPVDPSRLHIVPNGIPGPAPGMIPTSRLVDRPANRFLFCGNLSERKGVGLLLDALAHPDLARLQLKLTFVGGGDLAHYGQRAARNGVADRVEFLGWQDRETVSRYLLQSRALALPSTHEALPLAALEALAHGTPCITTPVGELAGFAPHGVVRFVRPGHLQDIVDAMRDLASDDALATRLSDAGRQCHQQTFSIERFVSGMRRAYAACMPSLAAS